MAIKADFHLHSHFSGDSDIGMEEMILKGIQSGLHEMCFTEHMDFDYPVSESINADYFILDTDAYLHDIVLLRERYREQMQVCVGVELGLQPHLIGKLAHYINTHAFDFVIASSHVCHGKDPYLPVFFDGRSEQFAWRDYFESILENITLTEHFDVYGHLDYVVRYGPNKDKYYSWLDYQDVIDEILTRLIFRNKGIELNTGAIRNGLKELNPCMGIVKRYRELGGEIITVGSDAHSIHYIAHGFDRAADILRECGFRYYTVFHRRTAEWRMI